jgi:hypothetical protein
MVVVPDMGYQRYDLSLLDARLDTFLPPPFLNGSGYSHATTTTARKWPATGVLYIRYPI